MSEQERSHETDIQFFARHLRWFVNFFAVPSLDGEELDTICSELEEKLISKSSTTLLRLGLKLLVVTMGNRGAYLTDGENSAMIPPIEVNEVTDTTGAGDAFSAGFIYKYVQHLDHDFEAFINDAKCGNLIAGRCIQKLGARHGIPTDKELKILLDEI